MTYGQCNKLKYSKECCHWNSNNPNNKFKNKKRGNNEWNFNTNGGSTTNKSDNKGSCGKVNKCGSIIYCYFICNFVEHKIYDYPHKDATQAMFREKAGMVTPKQDNVLSTWFW